MRANDMDHLEHLQPVAARDIAEIFRKESSYAGSWKARGGVAAWHMLARKLDRLEQLMGENGDVFSKIAELPDGPDGTVLAEIRDLRRYLLLVESEMAARGKLPLASVPEGVLEAPASEAEGMRQRCHDLAVSLNAAESEARVAGERVGLYAEFTLDALAMLRQFEVNIPLQTIEAERLNKMIRRAEALAVPNHVLGI